MNYDNHWFSSFSPEISHSLALPKEVDVAIIGGGFGGLALLFQLLRNNIKNVVLLEANTLGFKNTGRSTGQITLTGGQKYFSQYKDKKFAREYLKLTLQSMKQLNKSLEVLDCGFHQGGGLHLAKTEDELQFFKEEVEFLNQYDVYATELNNADVKNLTGLDTFNGGMFIPCEAVCNPYKMFFATKSQLNGFANLIYQNATVEYVEDNDILVSDRGTIRAKRIVYCSGLNLLPKLKSKTQVIFHQVVVSEKNDLPNINVTFNYNSSRLRTYDGRYMLDSVSKCKKMVDSSLLLKQVDQIPLPISSHCSYNEVVGKDGIPLIGQIDDNSYVMIGHDLSHACLSAAIILNTLKCGKKISGFDPMREI